MYQSVLSSNVQFDMVILYHTIRMTRWGLSIGLNLIIFVSKQQKYSPLPLLWAYLSLLPVAQLHFSGPCAQMDPGQAVCVVALVCTANIQLKPFRAVSRVQLKSKCYISLICTFECMVQSSGGMFIARLCSVASDLLVILHIMSTLIVMVEYPWLM